MHVIKKYIEKLEGKADETLITILYLIEKDSWRHGRTLEEHRKEIEQIKEDVDELKKNFDPVRAKVESDSKNRESRNKHIANTVIGLIIAAIFGWLGLK